jgi:YVTN family beta-propeller protein
VATIPAAQWPQGAFVTPDGSQVWITYPFQNQIDVIDTLTNTDVGGRLVDSPAGIAFNPTGTRAYVTSGGGTVTVFDAATLKQIGSYKVGRYPVDVSVGRDGRFVYVSNFADGTISVIDTVRGSVKTGTSAGATVMGLVQVQ